MFIPAEPLYSVALEQMPGLLEEGFAQGVLIATPTTLLGLLRAMSFGWREERLAESAQKISAEGRKLHEKVATVVEHLASLGNALNQSVKHYNRFLHSFEGRVVVSARRLAELDAKGRKDLGVLEEIQVRATRSRLPEEDGPARRSQQQPLLSLAPPANDDR
jgi:DNA recombination protein RmuC